MLDFEISPHGKKNVININIFNLNKVSENVYSKKNQGNFLSQKYPPRF